MAEEATNRPKVAWPRPRFTIRGLLAATAIVAALFPAAWLAWFLLLNASTAWGTYAVLGTALLLALAAAVAVSSNGAQRAFWSGFAAVGCVYFLLVVCDVTANSARYSTFDPGLLVTTRINRWVYRDFVFPSHVAKFGNAFPVGSNVPTDDDFLQVAHLLWTLLVAFCGGLASLVIWVLGQSRRLPGGDYEHA